MTDKYIATVDITADCGDKSKAFKAGDELDGVLPGCLDSMIRLGRAKLAEPKRTTTKSPPKEK